jgi:hypothetical protein
MIWALTMRNHKLSVRPWVRTWLRAGAIGKSAITLGAMIVLAGVWGVVQLLVIVTTPQSGWFGPQRHSPFAWLGVLTGISIFFPPLFLGVDRVIDWLATRVDIRRMMVAPDVVLATRGEYIGGHPLLPHGRFVYLTLAGTKESPQLNIVLPRPGDTVDETFPMPVLDVEKTRERLGEVEEEATTTVMLANVTFETQFMGQRSILNVEYVGKMGRRHQVEFGHFLWGDGEVQNWRNHIVCIQAQAETGERPYGPWKTLPSGQGSQVA